jgi:hypothetical protein
MMGGDMLDPVLLRSFLTVVQTGGFTRAAASLHLTQSTASRYGVWKSNLAPSCSTAVAAMW